jgi:pimeloyl-ACP methyl ester carboxylesterase
MLNERTIAINGTEMHVELDGAGEPLLCLHGTTGRGRDFDHAGRDELAREYQLIMPDQRGHGRTRNPEPTLTFRRCGDDVLALLDALGIERCKAIGLSLGGNALLHAATRAPERFTAMVLVSATSHFPESARRIMRQVGRDEPPESEWQSLRQRHPLGDQQIRALWGYIRSFAERDDDMSFTPSHLSTIQARTLIVYGDRDPLYPVEIAVEMYRAIARAALWVMPGRGHGEIFGDERETFVRIARAFLRGE